MNLRILLLKIRLKFFPRFSGKYDFNQILRHAGVSVGEHTIFYDPNSMTIDRERPWMLKIGDYCKITRGTTILCHDYSRSVLRRVCGEIIGEAGETVIGDNVFIGVNSVILMGAQIGNNVIIGAGSVVSGKIPDNCVAAGNPCKVIRTLDEHLKKRRNRTKEEAKIYYSSFVKKYNRKPSIKEMGPFFPLFLERSEKAIIESGVNVDLNGDDKKDIVDKFLQSEAEYSSYNEFILDMGGLNEE